MLINREKLLTSSVVANSLMNRSRGCLGTNSYQKDLAFNPIEFLQQRLIKNQFAAWLDICCVEGRALIEAAKFLGENSADSLQIIGIDLAGMFCDYSADLKVLQLLETSIEDFAPSQNFDLITCVHGLHYIGDKLFVIQRAASWLKSDGFFTANLDLNNLKLSGQEKSKNILLDFFKRQEFIVDDRKHLISLNKRKIFDLPFEYLGADDKIGPNYTGQPAVCSYYEL